MPVRKKGKRLSLEASAASGGCWHKVRLQPRSKDIKVLHTDRDTKLIHTVPFGLCGLGRAEPGQAGEVSGRGG